MSSRGGLSGGKRKRLGPNEAPEEEEIYALIISKGDMGIWKGEIKTELNITQPKLVDNCIKNLQKKGKIKEVYDVRRKTQKRCMGMEFEPSIQLTGGVWYTDDGKFDNEMIEHLSKGCKVLVKRHKVVTADTLMYHLKQTQGFKFELEIGHVQQILDTLCMENEVFKVRGNGLGEFASFPLNSECYKIKPKQKKTGALASIPCGPCPHINQCSPDGIISPATCVYFTKWLKDISF